MAEKTTRILEYLINGRDDSRRAFASVEKSINRVTNFAKSAAGALGLYFGTREVFDFTKDIIGLASAAEETASKFEIVFGSATDHAIDRLEVFGERAGRSRFQLKEMAADFQALIAPMGVATEQAADMSVELSKLASDLSSFFNTSDQQATIALRAGLVGESEPLRKYGVQLSATRIQQEAFTAGIGELGRDLTAAEKAAAAFRIIMRDTAQAQGDAARTAGSFANQARDIQGEWLDFKTQLGQEFLPVANEFLTWINAAANDLGGLGPLIKLTGLEYKRMILDSWDYINTASPATKIFHAFGIDPIGEMAAENAIAITELKAQMQLDSFKRDDRRREIFREEAERDRARREAEFNAGLWQGPLLPPGGRPASVMAPVPVTIEGGSNRPIASGPSGNPAAISGPLIGALAQATGGGQQVQREQLNILKDVKRTTADLRDMVRRINDRQSSGQAVIVGAFRN